MMNKVIFDGDRVIKRYTANGDFVTLAHALVGNFVYSDRQGRYRRERDRLIEYNKAGLSVPEYLGSEDEKLTLVMRKIPQSASIWHRLFQNNLAKRDALNYIAKSAELLRQIHEHGEHGDPWLSNFLTDRDGKIYAIDFEQQQKNGKDGDMSTLYLSGVIGIPDESEVRTAIKYGYGKEPEESGTLLEKVARRTPSLVKRIISG